MRYIAPKTKGALLPRTECNMSPYIPSARDVTDSYPEATWAILLVGTRTLCFFKFLLCYALIPNTKPIMLIVLYLLCSQLRMPRLRNYGVMAHFCTIVQLHLFHL